jgi:hypothetical protein
LVARLDDDRRDILQELHKRLVREPDDEGNHVEGQRINLRSLDMTVA